MASEFVSFLDQPVVGCSVAFVKNGQRMTSSPVVSVRPDPSNPGMLIVQTASGSTYTGQLQPNYQPTMYGTSTQYGVPPQPPPPPQAPAFCTRCGRPIPPGSHGCPYCGPHYQPGPGMMLDPNTEKVWAMLCHIGMFVIGFLAPLVILLTFGKQSRLADHHAKEALNFFITVLIAGFVCGLLCLVLIGYLLLVPLSIYVIVAKIIAGLKAYNGEYYEYPVVIRFF